MAAIVAVVAALLPACVAPDVEVIGALGVTVDAEARPILVVEACDGAANLVTLSYNRIGLADDEQNEDIASWTSAEPVAGKSALVLHAPTAPWQGAGVDLPIDRGYIAGAQGKGEKQVLTQVSFSGSDLAALEPGTVYRNHSDPDVTTLVGLAPADFSVEVCSRE